MKRLALAFSLAALAGCYAPDNPVCTYRCDPSVANEGHCPWDYHCETDGYCHANGSTGACSFPTSGDMSPVPDLLMSMPDMAQQPDLVTVFDLLMPTCTDKLKNGDETDVDCGGGTCPKCANGQMCVLPTDCVPGARCANGVCTAPSCTDKVKNGSETDVDCGGTMCPACTPGKTCAKASDCDSGLCGLNNVCASPSCTDQVKNGGESDVDCGGMTMCPRCPTGKMCGITGDCLMGNSCTAMICTLPPDMTMPLDLTIPPDLTIPLDMTMPPDLAMALPDLVMPPDLTPPPDLAMTDDGGVDMAVPADGGTD